MIKRKKASEKCKNVFLTFFPKGKKAMMDDLFDLFYTLAVSILLLLFINAALSGGLDKSNKKSISKLGEFKVENSAVSNLRVMLHSGGDLEGADINQMVKKSKKLAGRTITTCGDYIYEADCVADPVKVSGESRCLWLDDGCYIINR